MLVGCGTLFYKEQQLTFSSNVDNVKVTINDQSCNTPCQLKVTTSKNQLLLKGEKEGYQTKSAMLDTTMGNAFILDIIGGILFIAPGLCSTSTDVTNGHIYEYSPGHYYFNMEESKSGTRFKEADPIFFVLTNIHELRKEAAQNGGETISALSVMLKRDAEVIIYFINTIDNDIELAEKLKRLQ